MRLLKISRRLWEIASATALGSPGSYFAKLNERLIVLFYHFSPGAGQKGYVDGEVHCLARRELRRLSDGNDLIAGLIFENLTGAAGPGYFNLFDPACRSQPEV